MNLENIKLEFDTRKSRSSKRKFCFCTWLVWKDKSEPFNYIAGSVEKIAEKLGISIQEAEKLYIEKLEEVLPTIEDERIKKAIEERIRKIKHFPPRWRTPRVCVGCGIEFFPRMKRQFYHNSLCRKQTALERDKPRIKQRKEQLQPRLRLTIAELNNPRCPRCGNFSIKKGIRQRSDGIIQMYQCSVCKRTFPETYLGKPK